MAVEGATDNRKSEQLTNDLQIVHDSMLDGLGQLADYFGFSTVMGQLFGTLLLSAEPLSLDDMTARLGMSKASVSTNMRSLERMGMVRQVWVRGGNGRRKYYQAETDFWQIFSNILSGRELRDVERALAVMEENRQRISGTIDDLPYDEQLLARLYLDRIAQIQALFRFAQLIINSVLKQVKGIDVSNVSGVELQ
ncbi:MAG: helix-turn-helix domain-containing protein [Chloroflexota bacterium]|nr:helix-turn-helix domain-containing protein [Chloroflexota bacterium]